MPKSPEELAHLEWLGYVQPVGLVVSVPALLEAQCYVNKNIMADHATFLSCLGQDASGDIIPEITDLNLFVQQVLGWRADDLISVPTGAALPEEMSALEVILPQYNETLRPTHVVPAYKPAEGQSRWIMLVQELPAKCDFDEPLGDDSAKHWQAPPHAKFERLLRESGVPIGLLVNRSQLRLVYAPRGETSGYATFNIADMALVAGRPMFAALQMLLGADRLFNLADEQRLPYILENSRKYQNVVSTALAEQVTSALFELLRGFQSADDHRNGELLRQVLQNNPQHVYHGLVTVLMRLVFILYAEDRGLVSSEAVYNNYYSVSGLFERLRSEAGRFPDTMDQRFGAWAQLLTLFRLIYEGGQHSELKIPARKGYLFDPERYPFLEGRFDDGNIDVASPDERASSIQIPRISDGVIYRVLEDLLILDGERLSYRTLDVEQIGSVYEAIMGFELRVSEGKSIAIKPAKSHGAPAILNLEALLAAKPADRAKLLSEWTDQKLGGGDGAALKDAQSIDQLVAALEKKIAKHATPSIVPGGSMVFQPSDERRRSGSHYTPRSLTEPIVRTTLEPILKQLVAHPDELAKHGDTESQISSATSLVSSVVQPRPLSKELKKRLTKGEIAERERLEQRRADEHTAAIARGIPHPNQILDLKVCDPAMGSGAFLVEACRQLGDELIKAWHAHEQVPVDIPPDEDEVLYARRQVAQRCLYGVDKNIMAVDLAKLSLWLVTLAKDHPFTFLDHCLRHGDSLVGLTRDQIIRFHWESKQSRIEAEEIEKRLDRATEARAKILNAREDVAYRDQEQRLDIANGALDVVRLAGDACVSTFFAGSKKKVRDERCDELYGYVAQHFENIKNGKIDLALREKVAEAATSLRNGQHPIPPLHWEIEFPEVFSRQNGGFDAIVGNPPFAGKNTLVNGNRDGYLDWLKTIHTDSHGNSDLVAHFFRKTFDRLRYCGALGLVSTNTICQGDTRSTGLRWIRQHDGAIYNARRRLKWPGQAAVVVSVVHIAKGTKPAMVQLDDHRVHQISAYLFHAGSDSDPFSLAVNKGLCGNGVKIYGTGFTFEDNNAEASTIAKMKELVRSRPESSQRIFPYLGGEELNGSPTQSPHRFVIHFGELVLEEAQKWPELLELVRTKVKPEREKVKDIHCRTYWWQFERPRTEFFEKIKRKQKAIALSRVGNHASFCFVPSNIVFADSLVIFDFDRFADFAILQSRVHEFWARFFASSMKDDLRYTSSDCFETFPLPLSCEELEVAGEKYYVCRSEMMAKRLEGLTAVYNRFHDPNERDAGILKLRRLHSEMDFAVLRAYGWNDLADRASQSDFCQFLLDYEEEDDQADGDGSSGARRKKKPWRYRWPDDFRDEVLARLLVLNEQRYKEEQLAGASVTAAAGAASKKTGSPRKSRKASQSKGVDASEQDSQPELF